MSLECPHCFQKIDLYDGDVFDQEELPWSDGESVIRDCPHCHTRILIVAYETICHDIEEEF